MSHRILVLMIFVLSFLISCGEDSPTNSSKSSKISAIIPDSAKAGDVITIAGINFGIVQDTSYITFNNIRAINITSWTDKEIKLKVPGGAKSGKVSVSVNSIKSNEVDFTVIEHDLFESVTIGSQIWMKRNLDVDQYRNGDPIPEVQDSVQWVKLKTGAWCYYNNDPANGAVYGKLYNWYAINDPRGFAPTGWHVPSDDEWSLLTDYLGGMEIAGGKMKEADTTHWFGPNKGTNNSSGFTALPGGIRVGEEFRTLRGNCFLWSATEYDDKSPWVRYLHYNHTNLIRSYFYKSYGLSVRCIKD